jgi:hypothetical protein
MTKEIFQPMPSLEDVTKPMLTTDEAAYYLNRKPQTLRLWSCDAHHHPGPIAPMRINGRLGWRTKDVKALLGL